MVPRFDPHPAPRPSEPWDFVVDDSPPRLAPAGSARLLQPEHSVLRLVPDVGYRPWHNEAVMFLEKELQDGRIELQVRGAVVTGWYAAGADVLDFEAALAALRTVAPRAALIGELRDGPPQVVLATAF